MTIDSKTFELLRDVRNAITDEALLARVDEAIVNHHKQVNALTTRQAEIYEFIKRQVEKTGRSPSFWEITKKFGYASPNSATQHIESLVRKGWLTCEPHTIRGIRLVRQ